eukprot:2919601-Amphidinium_carterae.1
MQVVRLVGTCDLPRASLWWRLEGRKKSDPRNDVTQRKEGQSRPRGDVWIHDPEGGKCSGGCATRSRRARTATECEIGGPPEEQRTFQR